MNVTEVDGVFHCDCGFSWSRGKNGNHNCADGLRKKIQLLVADNENAMESIRQADAAVKLAHAKFSAIAAENVARQEFVKICFRAAADGASMDGADIQEIGERLGLFGRETYQPVLHGYICGHEAGEDSVYVMKSSPATDAYMDGIKADGAEELLAALENHETFWAMREMELGSLSPEAAMVRDVGLRAIEKAKQLREGAK